MKLANTTNTREVVSFRDAVIRGIAADGGLFMPASIPLMPPAFITSLRQKTFVQISFEIAHRLLDGEIPDVELDRIIRSAFSFPVPLHELDERIGILELFHGPTLAFKDFGARFLAHVLAYFRRNENRRHTILVATSGDTGSAVASGFFGMEGVQVVLLYPSGKVSPTQEQQLTTVGGNVTALEISGTFDDCQRMVKNAFADAEVVAQCGLTSANSINIARLIPQSFYYFEAFARISDALDEVIFAVPSGNLGNLTGGLIARKMGLPVKKFIAALNRNDVFREYARTGSFVPRASIPTISNAMDVGNPSNIVRIMSLRKENPVEMDEQIATATISDDETRQTIRDVFETRNYILDPHGAVAVAALRQICGTDNRKCIALATAHPAKFPEVVEPVLKRTIEKPAQLVEALRRPKRAVRLAADDKQLRAFLLDMQH